jgi:hypothetical protein
MYQKINDSLIAYTFFFILLAYKYKILFFYSILELYIYSSIKYFFQSKNLKLYLFLEIIKKKFKSFMKIKN